MLLDIINLRLLDVVDVLLVSILLYFLYNLVKGTVAINILIGIVFVYIIWKLVRVFEMQMLSLIMGQFISVGVLALIIIFQQEIRRFFLIIGTRSFINTNKKNFLYSLFHIEKENSLNVDPIIRACDNMSKSNTGALIVITKQDELKNIVESGEMIDANISQQLIENIFFKNSPLHDGALIITSNRMVSARCVLPVTDNPEFPTSLGLRHRASVGVTEQSDAISVIVSEQTGQISYCKEGKIKRNISSGELKLFLDNEFKEKETEKKNK